MADILSIKERIEDKKFLDILPTNPLKETYYHFLVLLETGDWRRTKALLEEVRHIYPAIYMELLFQTELEGRVIDVITHHITDEMDDSLKE